MTNPLKQGLKLVEDQQDRFRKVVVMTNPLKQGLKQRVYQLREIMPQRRNDESTKTRIETQNQAGIKTTR